MEPMSKVFLAAFVGACLLPHVSSAQATTSSTAVRDVHVGQQVINALTNAQAEKWYLYRVRAGRSYCAEAGAYEWDDYPEAATPTPC